MPRIPRPKIYPCVPVAAQVVNRPSPKETWRIVRRNRPRLDLLPYYIWEHFRRFCLPAVEKYFRPYYIGGTFFSKANQFRKKYFSVLTIYRTYLFAFCPNVEQKNFLGESFRPDPSWLAFHSLRPYTHLTYAEMYSCSPITRMVFGDNEMVLPDSLAIYPGMCWAMAYGLERKSICRKYRQGGFGVVWSPVKRKIA